MMRHCARITNAYRHAAVCLTHALAEILDALDTLLCWGEARSLVTGQACFALPSAYLNVCAIVSAQTLSDMYALDYVSKIR